MVRLSLQVMVLKFSELSKLIPVPVHSSIKQVVGYTVVYGGLHMERGSGSDC